MKMQKNKNRVFSNTIQNYFLSTGISLILLSCAATLSAAEYVYISDNLRVGVRTEPVSGLPPISVVFTGMRLELHENVDGYVRITTNKGISGWIKDIYVTKKMALNDQVDELKVERREWIRERATLMASNYKESSWFWVVQILVLIVLSFVAGVFWYKMQVMKRLGGLKV